VPNHMIIIVEGTKILLVAIVFGSAQTSGHP